MPIKFAIITCSTTRNLNEDTAGAALEEQIAQAGWQLLERLVVPDSIEQISAAIIKADEAGADIILTCGGTGLSPLDVTPEATAAVCDRNVPGLAEAMRAESLKVTGRAMLSRAVAMQRGSTLVINLPGSKKAALECFSAVAGQLEHAMEMSAGKGH